MFRLAAGVSHPLHNNRKSRSDERKVLSAPADFRVRSSSSSSADLVKFEKLEEIKNPNRFVKIRDLGSGKQGKAWLAHDKVINKQVVIKTILSKEEHKNAVEGMGERAPISSADQFRHELRILHHLRKICGTITPCFRGFFQKAGNLHGVTDYIGADFIPLADIGSQTLKKLLPTIVDCIWSSLRRIHRYGVTHNDVTDGNILVNSHTGKCIFIDFGLSTYSKLMTGNNKQNDDTFWTERQVIDLMQIDFVFDQLKESGKIDQDSLEIVLQITDKRGLSKLVELYF